MEKFEQRNPIPTVDIIIEYGDGKKKGIVLITRKNPPYGLALPGGFAELGLSYEDNARNEAKEETNLDVIIANPGHPYTYSEPDRDPRGHFATNVFYARGSGVLKAGDDAKTTMLCTIDEVIEMLGKSKFAFDHEKIVADYLKNKGYLA